MSQVAEGKGEPEGMDLGSVVVRPIEAFERGRWDGLMEKHHYLGLRSLVGESLRYVAEVEGRWLALSGWCTGAFKCGVRDRWIGWPPWVQWRRLHQIATQARFLILPGVRVANLASRVLGLNVRWLSADWQGRHGHGIVVAETFVDPRRFRGTCYRAAGWLELGATRGYGRRAGRDHEVVAVDGKSLRGAQAVLAGLPLAGKVVTADALHTQRELAKLLVEQKQADFCLPVKDNQPTVRADVEAYFTPGSFPP